MSCNDERVRFAWIILALAGCDKLYSIDRLPPPPVDALMIDASRELGCSDGTREGFADPMLFRSIAACSGAWWTKGLRPDPPVSCDRMAGNDGIQVLGMSCSATDLCAVGWHVCRSRLEVLARLPVAHRSCGELGAAPNTFYATAQSGPGASQCDDTGTNDVFGCGTYGLVADNSCAPLDRSSDNMCFTIRAAGGWDCVDSGSEVTTILKTDPGAGGGVLCCRDEIVL
jgi:hypothetical protein